MDFWNARPSKKNKIPSFLNTPVQSIQGAAFFRKESLRTPRRKLSTWGDIDMDGSPNKFDCNPFNPAEDGIISRILGLDKEKQKRKFDERIETKSKGFIERQEKRQKFKTGLNRLSSGITNAIDRASTPKNINPKTGRYSKESLRAQKRTSGRVISLVRAFTPPGTIAAVSKKSGKGKKGRPMGPSGRYVIPGVGAVGVYQYRTWLRQQRKLRRLKMRTAPTPVMEGFEAEALPTGAQQIALEDVGGPANQNLIDNVIPARQFNQTNRIRQPLQVRQIQPAGTDNLNYQQQMQLIMQQRDNILNAPTIIKGELAGTGGDILSDAGRPNILQAPNIQLGQMRNFYERSPVELGERPISNPRGEYFTDIDPISGKPMLRRRISEKWLTGEAI